LWKILEREGKPTGRARDAGQKKSVLRTHKNAAGDVDIGLKFRFNLSKKKRRKGGKGKEKEEETNLEKKKGKKTLRGKSSGA